MTASDWLVAGRISGRSSTSCLSQKLITRSKTLPMADHIVSRGACARKNGPLDQPWGTNPALDFCVIWRRPKSYFFQPSLSRPTVARVTADVASRVEAAIFYRGARTASRSQHPSIRVWSHCLL
jgi:hypothetical protein